MSSALPVTHARRLPSVPRNAKLGCSNGQDTPPSILVGARLAELSLVGQQVCL
jgi:hypothetical protein